MTFWMLAGLSFAFKSYTMHGVVDYGLLFSAVSQYESKSHYNIQCSEIFTLRNEKLHTET